MYKGNIRDFEERLNSFLDSEFGVSIHLANRAELGNLQSDFFLRFDYGISVGVTGSSRGYYLSDSEGVLDKEDLEDQVLKIVKSHLIKQGKIQE
jgi:hypothetical protein